MPLQPADPQHQFGQGGGALVQLDAAQLLQRDGFAFQAELVLGVAQSCLELVQHLAFQALQVLQRHVQEVAAAAGRVEHAGGAQLVVEAAHLGAGFGQLVAPRSRFLPSGGLPARRPRAPAARRRPGRGPSRRAAARPRWAAPGARRRRAACSGRPGRGARWGPARAPAGCRRWRARPRASWRGRRAAGRRSARWSAAARSRRRRRP
jgi:hypothetical protein